MPNIGPLELFVVFLIVLLVFGPKSLPKIMQATGKGIKEFKDAVRGISSDIEDDPAPPPAARRTAAPAAPAAEEKQPSAQHPQDPQA